MEYRKLEVVVVRNFDMINSLCLSEVLQVRQVQTFAKGRQYTGMITEVVHYYNHNEYC